MFTHCGHLELPEHGLRLHPPGVSAAHQVVLQHGARWEGEVAHLHTVGLRRVLHRVDDRYIVVITKCREIFTIFRVGSYY